MAIAMMSWMLAIPVLGMMTGLRAMTPIAVVCWFAYLGDLPVDGTWAQWMQKLWVAILFSVLAAAECVGDKLPKTPNRISPLPLLARLVFGGLVGSVAATALNEPGIEGVLLGVMGAGLGAFAGFMLRRELVEKIGCADWPVAVGEDLLTLVWALLAMHVITG